MGILNKKLSGYQEGGEVRPGLLKRYNRHVSSNNQINADGTAQIGDNVILDTGGFNPMYSVKTKHGASVTDSNPYDSTGLNEKAMKKVIKIDRGQAWDNFKAKLFGKNISGTFSF
jgi:hypothetical protein